MHWPPSSWRPCGDTIAFTRIQTDSGPSSRSSDENVNCISPFRFPPARMTNPLRAMTASAGEDGAVRGCGAGPALRPPAIVEVEAGLAVRIAEGFIEGELAGRLIELYEVEAMNALDVRCHHDAVGGSIPSRPMGVIVA